MSPCRASDDLADYLRISDTIPRYYSILRAAPRYISPIVLRALYREVRMMKFDAKQGHKGCQGKENIEESSKDANEHKGRFCSLRIVSVVSSVTV